MSRVTLQSSNSSMVKEMFFMLVTKKICLSKILLRALNVEPFRVATQFNLLKQLLFAKQQLNQLLLATNR